MAAAQTKPDVDPTVSSLCFVPLNAACVIIRQCTNLVYACKRNNKIWTFSG